MKRCLVVLVWLTGCTIPEKQLTSGGRGDLWGLPTALSISIPGADDHPTLTDDMLEMYFVRSSDIYASSRTSLATSWTTPARIAELSTQAKETAPEVSPDGLTIYFASDAPGGPGGIDIWTARRASRSVAWGAPALVNELNSTADDKNATPAEDSNVIVMATDRAAGQGYDLYMSSKEGAGPWGTPTPIAGVNTTSKEAGPMLSADRLTLYFYSDRAGNDDLFESARADNEAAFPPGIPIAELNSADQDANPWVSPDGRNIFFSRGNTLFEAMR